MPDSSSEYFAGVDFALGRPAEREIPDLSRQVGSLLGTSSLSSIMSGVLEERLSKIARTSDVETRAANVAMYRRYVDGDHNAKLTSSQRAALSMEKDVELTDNYVDVVVRTMLGRLRVKGVKSSEQAATDWATQLMTDVRFDAFQMTVHEATIVDGDTFVMVWWDNDAQRLRFSHEPLYDGTAGIIPIYRSSLSTEPEAIVKIWDEWWFQGNRNSDVIRANVYYSDRVERYYQDARGRFQPFTGRPGEPTIQPFDPWVDRQSRPLGLNMIHFRNRPRGNWGISEVSKIVPLQDALNNLLHDVLMTSRLTAFQLKVAIGFEPPDAIVPGDWIHIPAAPTTTKVGVDKIDAGDLTPLLDTARWLTREIGNVSSTAAPELFPSDDLSGEAFKQRESNLVAKCNAFQTVVGNAWEDVFSLGARIQNAFGSGAPEAASFSIEWHPAASESRTETVELINKVASHIGERETVSQLAKVFGWDETMVDTILADKERETLNRVMMELRPPAMPTDNIVEGRQDATQNQ